MHLDLRHLGEKHIDTRIPFLPLEPMVGRTARAPDRGNTPPRWLRCRPHRNYLSAPFRRRRQHTVIAQQ